MDEAEGNMPERREFVRAFRLDSDLDKPLFRIFPLWAFEDMLRVGRLVLVPPSFWEDPQEDIPSSIMMEGPNHSQKPLAEYLNTAFGQCWSFESESDSLLRAYSRVTIDKVHGRNIEPRYEGVQVRTTPRKLIDALQPWAMRSDWGQIYLGRVEYLSGNQATQNVTNILARIGPREMGRGENRAQSLLLKRKAFSHEDEVRLIFVCIDTRKLPEPLTVNLEPNDFIDEILYDPRLILFERREREEKARSLGYRGPFAESSLYQRTLFKTILPWNWGDWESGQGLSKADQ